MCLCQSFATLCWAWSKHRYSSEAKQWTIVWADALNYLLPNIRWPTQWHLPSWWAQKFKEDKDIHDSCAYKQSASLIAGVWERLLDSISQRLSYTSASIKASFYWSLWKRAILFQVLASQSTHSWIQFPVLCVLPPEAVATPSCLTHPKLEIPVAYSG